VPSILILISSSDNKQYHKRYYLFRIWCICPISNKEKRRMSIGVLERRQRTNTWSL